MAKKAPFSKWASEQTRIKKNSGWSRYFVISCRNHVSKINATKRVRPETMRWAYLNTMPVMIFKAVAACRLNTDFFSCGFV
jgi:hypothetical protein